MAVAIIICYIIIGYIITGIGFWHFYDFIQAEKLSEGKSMSFLCKIYIYKTDGVCIIYPVQTHQCAVIYMYVRYKYTGTNNYDYVAPLLLYVLYFSSVR